MPTRSIAPLALAALSALAGCGSLQTTVEVRNESKRTVSVTLEREVIAADSRVLARETISAGDVRLIGPVETPPFEPAVLRVKVPGELGALDSEIQLPRGRSTAVIEGARLDSWGELSVRLLRDANADE